MSFNYFTINQQINIPIHKYQSLKHNFFPAISPLALTLLGTEHENSDC
jgi:hypothetical protein